MVAGYLPLLPASSNSFRNCFCLSYYFSSKRPSELRLKQKMRIYFLVITNKWSRGYNVSFSQWNHLLAFPLLRINCRSASEDIKESGSAISSDHTILCHIQFGSFSPLKEVPLKWHFRSAVTIKRDLNNLVPPCAALLPHCVSADLRYQGCLVQPAYPLQHEAGYLEVTPHYASSVNRCVCVWK